MQSNERGSYGDDHGSSGVGIVIGFGLMAVIYGLSPGARHFYKHGHLPQERALPRRVLRLPSGR